MQNIAIFLDRDGTIIEDPGYINNPEQVKLLAGSTEALIELKELGYKLIVVSNQSGVARGIVSERTLKEIHERLNELLAEKQASLDAIYYCPYHPEGSVARYRKESEWRKPNPGMLLAAAQQFDIDLENSWMIGNSGRDIEAGRRAECKTVFLEKSEARKENQPESPPADYKAVNLKEAANIVRKHSRQMKKASQQKYKGKKGEPVLIDNRSIDESATGQTFSQTTEGEAGNHEQGTEKLLGSILEQLRVMHRTEMFTDFSVIRFLAGIVQVLVLLCLLISILGLMDLNRNNAHVLISLGFAGVLQLMALTLYMMHNRR